MLFSVLFFSGVFAWSAAPFAVLKTGPERQWGFPGFENDSGLCLYGSYALQDKSSVIVRAVPVRLAYTGLWKSAGIVEKPSIMRYNEGNLFAAQITLRNRQQTMQGALDWTVLFEFEPQAGKGAISVFIAYFLERFEYFGSIAPSIADISFPAVLGEDKNKE